MARKSESNWVRIFEVTNPTRHKKFTVYKVTSKVFPKSCPEGATVISVWKRYNDFKKLYKELAVIHKQLHLTGEFPKFPKAKVFGRFDYEIVEERRKAAWTLLEFSANHSQLFTHKIFVSFFEHGYKIKEHPSTQNLDRIDGSTNDSCLIPEKLWSEADAISISSVESSSADTTTFTTDSDSVVSNSVLSDTATNNPSHSPYASVDLASLPHSAFNVSSKNSSLRSEIDSGLHSDQTPRGDDSLMGDSYTEAETRSQSSFSVVSSSKSCPALDEISSASTCSSSQLHHQPQQAVHKTVPRSLKRSWGLSMKRNSNGLSGFFDFLPIFPKKVEEKKRSDEKLLTNSLSVSYICEAAGHFAVAQQFESNGELAKALESYKEGIKILLHGGQSDKDTKRRIIVKSKIEKYLSKAEALHSSLHCDEKSTCHSSVTSALFSPKKVQSLLTLKSSSLDKSSGSTDSMKASDLEDLRNYKVVGVASSGVLLVVDVAQKHQPKCYAIKVLRKSASPMTPNKTIVASQVPFMVKLVKWYNTENTIILLLQYAGGGKLEDFIYNYQTKQISIIPHETQSPCDNEIDKADGMEYIDDHSFNERKNAMAVLGAFAEQMETKRRLDLNGNLGSNEQGELCDSYARLFQESDSEDTSNEAQIDGNDELKVKTKVQTKNGNAEVENNLEKKGGEQVVSGKRRGKSKKECLDSAAEMGGKLAVDSSTSVDDGDDMNEALEIGPVSCPIPITTTTRIKTTASRGRTMKVKASKAFPPPDVVENDSVISWSNLDAVDTSDLIENSKVLLQTVSRTLTQCDTAAAGVVVDDGGGGINSDHELKSESKEPSREQNKKNGRPTPPGASSSSSSREYGDYNNGSSSVNGTDGVSVSDQTMSFLESPNSSLSLSAGKQKPVETNETENNNNKGSSQNGASLMSGESDGESKSQCSKLKVNQKPTVSQTTRKDDEEDKGWVRTDCSDVSNDKSETSADELLVSEISDEPKLGTEEDEGSTMASPYCQPIHNGDSSECEPLPIQRMVPECCVKVWIAEIVLALEKLHSIGLTYGDLGMRNILLGENGHILLSFISQWSDVDYDYVPPLDEWVAPEARINFGNSIPSSRENFHFSVDFWSLGTILFYLLTGRTVQSCHPEGSHANTALKILDTNLCGEYISAHAKSLMTELLQMNPMLRLGYYGAEEIKTHPFFDGFDWDKALEEWGKNV